MVYNLTDFYSVCLTGEVTSIESCRALGHFLRRCFQEGHTKVAVDWSEVTEVSGSLAGFLVVANDRFRKAGGELRLVNARPLIAEVFMVVGLHPMLIEEAKISGRHDKRALVVEDDPNLRELTHEYMKDMGFSTLVADDGHQALVLFKMLHRQIDLVITDIEMPRMDGLDFFRQANDINPECRFIVATGYTHSEKLDEFMQIRPNIPILRKPYLPNELDHAVAEEFSRVYRKP